MEPVQSAPRRFSWKHYLAGMSVFLLLILIGYIAYVFLFLSNRKEEIEQARVESEAGYTQPTP